MSEKSGGEVGVKINIVERGCNGLSYKMEYIKEEGIQKLDEVIQSNHIKVVVDQRAVMFLVGTQMDYQEDELKAEFVFNNPNAKGTCGCGESFHI